MHRTSSHAPPEAAARPPASPGASQWLSSRMAMSRTVSRWASLLLPTAAAAASRALARSAPSRATFSSTVPVARKRCTHVSCTCPMRCTRPMAWASTAGSSSGSTSSTCCASVRLSPLAPCCVSSISTDAGGPSAPARPAARPRARRPAQTTLCTLLSEGLPPWWCSSPLRPMLGEAAAAAGWLCVAPRKRAISACRLRPPCA
mmetsp:Transcript_47932/g.120966  ORF Transcript_47932/g.120966 Transcript_47932/m.120966 type:complete len:203 (-) Transcript_47932:2019-2627(-)